MIDPAIRSGTLGLVTDFAIRNRREMILGLTAAAGTSLLLSSGCAPAGQACPSPAVPPAPPPPAGLLDQDLRLLSSPGTELPIVQRVPAGSNVLRRLARELRSSDDVQLLEKRMRATLEVSQGVGIAAPQVGISARAILVMHGARPAVPGGPTHPHVEWYVNPRIVERSDEITLDYEGCLSIADVCGLVRRHRRVVVEFGVAGSPAKRVEASGFDARIFQHEIDHLEGVLYVDRVEGGLQPKDRVKELREQLRREHPEQVAVAARDVSSAIL